MKSNIATSHSRHLFASPHLKGIAEGMADIAKLSPSVTCFAIHSADTQRRKGSVEDRVQAHVASTDPKAHVCLFITHATLMAMDCSIFEGWHLHLDEQVSNAVMSGDLYAPVSWPTFAAVFDLHPVGDGSGRSRLSCNPDVELRAIIEDDRLSESDKNLFKRVKSPVPVFIDATDWRDISKARCGWQSVWSYTEALSPFASVEIASSDLMDSLSYLIAPFPMNGIEVAADPSKAKVRIAYFDEMPRAASSEFWKKEGGQANLALIAAHLKAATVEYWSANHSAVEFLKGRLDADRYISPCCEGLNGLHERESCAMLYSSKAQGHEAILCRDHSTLTLAEISERREANAIFQFAMRGRARDRDFNGEYRVYVYDRAQAASLKEKFLANGFPDTTVEHIALKNFADRQFEKVGRKPKFATIEEREEQKRKLSRERQQRSRAKREVAKKLAA